ncbi:hypothetical protein ACU8V3_12515 [Cobetia marina]
MTTMLQARLYQRLARHPWWSLALLYLLVSAIGLGMRMPWPADEPRFALNGLEMWVTGHWWLPHRGESCIPTSRRSSCGSVAWPPA